MHREVNFYHPQLLQVLTFKHNNTINNCASIELEAFCDSNWFWAKTCNYKFLSVLLHWCVCSLGTVA